MIFLWAILLNVCFGVLFYFAERNVQDITIADALWWSMVTMTTVGYGDFYAKSLAGRFLISYPCMILGIGLIGYLVGSVANTIIDFSARKRGGLMQISETGHILICNYPGEEKIKQVISELESVEHYRNSRFVVITDVLSELPDALRKHGVLFVKGMPTQEEVLLRANILKCAGVIVLATDSTRIESDERTYTVASVIKQIEREHSVPVKTITELISEQSVDMVKRLKVNGITSEDGVSSCLLAQEFVNPGINGVISQLITSRVGSQLYIVEAEQSGRSIRDLQKAALDHDTNIQILGLIRGTEHMLNPSKNTVLESDDHLIVLAESAKDVATLEKEIIA
jgi:voltage-gated potassium channel